ncbi:MAG TPA: hypothetical protein VGM84_10005 [Steroidobacteraceae bacterium]|jgi:hypothetical protein
MIRSTFAVGILLVAQAALADAPVSYILPAGLGPTALNQCSRSSPQNVEEFFTPDPGDVADMEIRLVPYIKNRSARMHFESYGRQYVGFTRKGRRYLYGNFFNLKLFDSFFRLKDPQSKPVVICDGGDNFWGIVYSLDSRSFSDLQFNGVG